MFKVAVTGGIGSGKSTLCDIFRKSGVPIYNSDEHAKRLMNENADIRRDIISNFGEQCYINGDLNREYLSSIVFSDREKLSLLNSIVHPRVITDFELWATVQDAPFVILECAILFEANFDKYIDVSICVLAPLPLRIARVISRDGLTKEQVESRIASQISDDEIHRRSTYCVVNIDRDDLENAASMLSKKIAYEASKN